MIERFELRKIKYIPAKLDQGVLYVAEEFGAAVHLCACGCGSIVRTPLDRWSLIETKEGPSLDPSVGNWQERCQSHYWIERGNIRWAPKWTPEEITEGRQREEKQLSAYYEGLDRKRVGKIRRFVLWLKELL